MPDDQAKRACRAVWFSLMDGQVTQELAPRQHVDIKELQIELLLRFARQQQAVGVRMLKVECFGRTHVGEPCTCAACRNLNELVDWCDATAKELEGK